MFPPEEKEKALWRQQKHLEIKEELQRNEKLREILETVQPEQRAAFIDEYAHEKVRWLEYGPLYVEWLEAEDLKWVNDATERLGEIQQKKLFDLQCQWRAEKIELPDVKLTYDFLYWQENVLSCPFLSPISEDEFDLYMQYMNSGNFQMERNFLQEWQDYRNIKAAYNSEDEEDMSGMPEWYDFHNGRTGSSAYLLLPNVREEKEQIYIQLWHEEQKMLHQQKLKTNEEKLKKGETLSREDDTRPVISPFTKGQMTFFVSTFEDKKTQEMFERYGGESRYHHSTDDSDGYNEAADEALRLLARADRIMPIEASHDWREAVLMCAYQYRLAKIIEAMPTAYEQYRINADLHISSEPNERVFKREAWYHEAILRGRELNGEPRDFDF